jgi:hypothetical protein
MRAAERDAARAQARRRAAEWGNGIGAAFLAAARDPGDDAYTTWKGIFLLIDGADEADLLVRSRAHGRSERANLELIAEIIEEAVAESRATPLAMVGRPTGLILEDQAPHLIDAVFLDGTVHR